MKNGKQGRCNNWIRDFKWIQLNSTNQINIEKRHQLSLFIFNNMNLIIIEAYFCYKINKKINNNVSLTILTLKLQLSRIVTHLWLQLYEKSCNYLFYLFNFCETNIQNSKIQTYYYEFITYNCEIQTHNYEKKHPNCEI